MIIAKAGKRKTKTTLSAVRNELLWTRPDILFDGTEVIGAKPIREAVSQRGADQATPSGQKPRKVWRKDADPSTHYTPADLSDSWGCSVHTVRRLFRDDPDTLKITKSNPKKRTYTTTMIPQAAANRMYEKLKRGHR